MKHLRVPGCLFNENILKCVINPAIYSMFTIKHCNHSPMCTLLYSIEEGWRQKARQNVVVLEWGARSNATRRILV